MTRIFDTDVQNCLLVSRLLIIVLLSVPGTGVSQDPIILEYGNAVRALAYSPTNASLLASAGTGNVREDSAIKIWDLDANRTIWLQGHTDTVKSIAFSPNGKRLASGGSDWTIRLWDVERQRNTETKRHVIDRSVYPIQDLDFSPDGDRLATAGGAYVIVWEVRTMTELFRFRHSQTVWTLAFSPNGKYLATGEGGSDGPGHVRLWDIETQEQVALLDADRKAVYSVAFSSNNRTLVTAGWRGSIKFWDVSDWQLQDTIHHGGTILSLAFSPDGKILAAAGARFLGLWSSETGAPLEFVSRDVPSNVWATAFSNDGNSIVSGGSDGLVRIQNIKDELLQEANQAPMVRVIYFVPSDRVPRLEITAQLDTVIKETQRFFGEQMQTHGRGRKTFMFETDATGNVLVRQVAGKFPEAHYNIDTWDKIGQELESIHHNKHVDVVIVDMSKDINIDIDRRVCGKGTFFWSGGGRALIPANACFSWTTVAHELGHAFGLEHDFRNDQYIMSYGAHRWRLSECAAAWLNRHRCFNPNQTGFNEPTTIEMFTPVLFPPDGVILHFKIDDADGLHHGKLIASTFGNDSAGGDKLYDCQSLSGKIDIVEFVVPELPEFARSQVTLRVIDVNGNFSEQTFSAVGAEEVVDTDVNGDGRTTVQDLVRVAALFGQSGEVLDADVNRDGVVDVVDLLFVAVALRDAEGAPTARPLPLVVDLPRWIAEAKQYDSADKISRDGILALEQLLMELRPEATALLPNYPNPFNPETWIPYQLASPAEVTLTIYDMNGGVIRQLEIGSQAPGVYQSRSRAAYWDGRNRRGESVASGLYFYTLRAGEFTATRKMLIRK